MAIDKITLESERDSLKNILREIETEQRQLETQQKSLRQKEMRTKRQLEALETLLDVTAEPVEEKSQG